MLTDIYYQVKRIYHTLNIKKVSLMYVLSHAFTNIFLCLNICHKSFTLRWAAVFWSNNKKSWHFLKQIDGRSLSEMRGNYAQLAWNPDIIFFVYFEQIAVSALVLLPVWLKIVFSWLNLKNLINWFPFHILSRWTK